MDSQFIIDLPEFSDSTSSQSSPECLLFVSFDISGNTEFKQTNPTEIRDNNESSHNFVMNPKWANNGWFVVVSDIFAKLISILELSETNFRFWKFQGDELILTVSIQKFPEIVSAIHSIDIILRETSLKIWKETNQRLDLKATTWLAAMDERLNRVIDLKVQSLNDKNTVTDYIGTSIDEGFRIAHAVARSKRMVVSFDIALLMAKENINEARNIYHVGFGELKGIWKQKPYPALWYSTEFIHDREITPYYFITEGFDKYCKLTQQFCASPDLSSGDTLPQTQALTDLLENIYQHIPQAREHHDVMRSVLNLNPL
jgi:hypothetical protein